MKKIICMGIATLVSMLANAITLNVSHPKNIGMLSHNTGAASMQSSTVRNCKDYDISIYRSKSDVGIYHLVCVTCALISESNGGMKTAKNSTWIPQSFQRIEIPTNTVGKMRFVYSTPSSKFKKEKWEYIGNYSKGAKINGAFIALVKEDNESHSLKIVRTFKDCTGIKLPKTCDELRKISEDKITQDVLEDLNYIDDSRVRLDMVDSKGNVIKDKPVLNNKNINE